MGAAHMVSLISKHHHEREDEVPIIVSDEDAQSAWSILRDALKCRS